MTLIVIHGLRVTMKYVVDNNGSLTFQRAVPQQIRCRYPKKLIKVPLPRDLSVDELKAVVDELEKETTQLFRLMRNDPDMLPAESKRAVNAVFKHLGIKIDPNGKISESDQAMFEDAYAENFGKDLTKVGHWRITQRFLWGEYSLLLSECAEIYLKVKAIDVDSKAGLRIVRDWNRFLELVGDMSVQQLHREQIRDYVTRRLDQGAKTGTVRRELNTLRASTTLAFLERKLNYVNPFEGIVIPREGSDEKRKEIFAPKELKSIFTEALAKRSEIGLLAVLMSHTAMRIGEAVGLRRSDCKESSGIRYIRVEPHGSRTLKTETSRREIPLVGMALQALDDLLQMTKGSEFLFPRYATSEMVKADTASASLNKWLRRVTGNPDVSSHCFRHTLEDLMREANVPKPIQTAIGGWGKTDMSDNYGKGYSLRMKKEALEAALASLRSSVNNA
jgi:integrase